MISGSRNQSELDIRTNYNSQNKQNWRSNSPSKRDRYSAVAPLDRMRYSILCNQPHGTPCVFKGGWFCVFLSAANPEKSRPCPQAGKAEEQQGNTKRLGFDQHRGEWGGQQLCRRLPCWLLAGLPPGRRQLWICSRRSWYIYQASAALPSTILAARRSLREALGQRLMPFLIADIRDKVLCSSHNNIVRRRYSLFVSSLVSQYEI
jgi:hypothetical protein